LQSARRDYRRWSAEPSGMRPVAGRDDGLVVPAIAGDGSLFPAGKMDVHRTGQQHLAVSVFVFCGSHLLIQRRALEKYHCGGMWANTCCTHPHWGESPSACAHRRLREEVGIELPLEARAVVDYRAEVTNGLIENERVHVFEGVARDMALPAAFDPAEVAELRWIDRPTLRAAITAATELYTPWLRIYLDRWSELALRAAA
jgi:isopentenyl-diphosphate delta-isomerase